MFVRWVLRQTCSVSAGGNVTVLAGFCQASKSPARPQQVPPLDFRLRPPAVNLLRSPQSLAYLLEAAGAAALERCGAILDRWMSEGAGR